MILVAILASSSDSDSGGLSPPPAKKQRVAAASAMQANDVDSSTSGTAAVAHNGTGDTINSNGTGPGGAAGTTNHANGSSSPAFDEEVGRKASATELSPCDRDIVRLIGQHLLGLGYT